MDFHSMKRKELQALCKKHKIPANLTNLEMANRLTSLLKGKDKLFTKRRSCLKALDENGCEIESDVENKRVKKVRFSRETHMIEFEKSDAKVFEVKRRGRRKSLINEVRVVENVGGPELSEGVGHVTRSRGRRLVGEGVTERKGGLKDDALGSNLSSSVDKVASIDVHNEESRVMTRRSLRKREVVDEGKRKQEGMEKGLKKKERERNLKQGNDKARDNVAERGESDVECVEVPAEKVLRRSKRNVMKVEDYKLMTSGTAAAGSSLKPVDSPVSEGSGPSGMDIDAAMEEKKRSLVGVAMRRSRRNACRNEPLITLDDLVAEVNYERKMKKQRRDPVVEQEAILVDSITIELPVSPSSRNVKRSKKAAPAIVAGKCAQKAKRKSKRQIIEIEDSTPEGLTTKELADVDGQPSLTEVAESAINRDSDNEGFIDNLKKQKKRSGKNSGRKSPPKVQDSSKGVNGEITASESTEFDYIGPGTETSHSRTKEVGQDVKVTQEIKKNLTEHLVFNCYSEPAADCSSAIAEQFFEGSSIGGDVISSEKLSVADGCLPIDQLDSRDPKGIQLWVELSIDVETMSRPTPLDHLVEDEGISSDKSPEYIEHQGLETVRVDELERYGNASLNGPCERDGSTSLVKDKTCEVNPANPEDADPNYSSDRSSTLSSGRALEQRDLSLSMQTNDGEVDDVAGDRNFEQEELKCTTSAKSDEHNPLEENYDASDKFYESNFAEPFRSVTRLLEDGNVNGAEDSEEPADLKGKHLGSSSIAANTMETNCTQIEYSTGISSFESTENALEFNLTSEYPVSGTIVEGGHCFLQDTNVQKQVKSIDVDLDKHLEPRKKSLSIQQNDVGPDDAAEAEKHFADVKISAELPKFDEEENLLGKFWESNPFDSSGCKLRVLGDLDANVNKDFVGDVDSERLVLAVEDFTSHTTDESKESYEDESEKDGDGDLIESCIRETEKVDNNFEEPTNSEVSMAAVISGTGDIIHIPTGDFIEDSTTTTMKSDITLEQKGQSTFLHKYGSEADNVAEEDIAHNQVDLNSNELDQSVEDRHFEEQCQPQNVLSEYSAYDPSKRSDRRMLKNDISNGGGDSTKGITADLKAEKEGSAGLIELCVREECFSAQKENYDENSANSEDVMAATKCRTSISPHVSVGHNYDESTSAMNLDTTLEQRKQSPTVHWNGCEAGSVAEVNRNCDQVELKCDELSESAEARPLEKQYHSPKKCRKSSISDTSIRSARSLLQYEIDDGEDSVGLQKNAAGQKKSYEAEPDKDENVGFIQSCVREECTSAKRDDNYKENPMNSVYAMAAMKCGTGNSPRVSVLNIEEATTNMNLDISLNQREHSPVVHRNESDPDGVAEVDRNYGQVVLKCDELSKTIEDRPFDEKYHSPGSNMQGGEDSLECQKNSTSSRKNFEDGPDKDGNIDFTDSHIIKKCISVQIADNSGGVPVYSENPMEEVVSTAGNLSHIPLVDINEHTGSRNLDMALDQREQSPVLQMKGCHADNVAEEDRIHNQVELYCDESAESVKDRCLEEQYHLPNKCLVCNVSYSSRRSASRMLQDDSVRGGEDPMKRQEKSYEIAPEEDGNAGSIESYVIDKCTTAKNYEDNPANSKDAMEEISRTVNFAHTVDNNEDHISNMNLEMALEKREQSPAMEQNGCETNKSADLLGTCIVTPSLALEAVERNCSAIEFSSSISNFGCTDPLDFIPTLDGPEVSGDANKSGHSTFPDTSAQKREDIMDAMEQSSKMLSVVADDVADAFKTCEEVNNYVGLAGFERGNNNAEDVVDRKFQEVVLAVQMCPSYVIEASDTSAEGVHFLLSDNDAQQQGLTSGDETFSDNKKKEDNNGISEKISDFASTELSEAKFKFNNFQEEFSCKDKEDNAKEKRENLAATFSQVQFTMSEIHTEEKIVDIADNVSSKLYKHHEMLKESDVADTINEYIESESTLNPSLRIDDASDTLHIGGLTKVSEPEDKNAEETIEATGRKFEVSVERDDQEKGEAADLKETALGSAWISDSTQSKNSDVVADKNICLGKQFTSEMREKNIRTVLIHGTPRKLQMVADMKENLACFKMEKIGCLTTMKPTTKRPALKDVLQKI